jgi:epoxide hydrolase 4
VWAEQLRRYGDRYRCVAVDMRGYNDSDKPVGVRAYDMDVLAADVRALVEALGYRTCTLVAHDWGGVVAWSAHRT